MGTVLRRSGGLAGTVMTVFCSDFVGMKTRFVGIVATPAERAGVKNINGLDGLTALTALTINKGLSSAVTNGTRTSGSAPQFALKP